jgi:TetR/AcrR family transcriptional regulator
VSDPIPARDPSPPASSRAKILDVAEARFARRGYAGVGLREVAEAAGLSKSSLFHHFRSKAALYLSVIERVIGRIAERLAPVLARRGSSAERLDAVIDNLIDALAEHPTAARLLLRALFEDDDIPTETQPEGEAVERRIAGLVEAIERLVEQGAADGAFRPTSAAHTLQTLIGATVYHFASGDFGEGLMGGPLFSAEAVRRRKQEVKAFVRHGLTPRPVG